jgi:hypothetical protein
MNALRTTAALIAGLFWGTSFGLKAEVAPDFIRGKAYRDDYINSGARTSRESTIVFGSDGRFTYLRYSVGNANYVPAPYRTFLSANPGDGTYEYSRTGNDTGEVLLRYDDGKNDQLRWTFASASAGTYSRDGGTNQPQGRFTLADLESTIPATNLSLRGRIAAGQSLIFGLVVPGTPSSNFPPTQVLQWQPMAAGQHSRDLLIRVVGPSLVRFGVTGVWADPDFQIFRGNVPADLSQGHYPNWSEAPPGGSDASAAFQKIFSFVGAFPLDGGSKDAVDVVRLPPGAYTVVASVRGSDPGGETLIEVYWLP